MAELQSKKKSFNQAFAEARKRGESKFQWNGAWYSTQTSEEKNVQTKGGIDKADYKQKMANRNGTVSNRFTVRHKNDVGYYVWDNDLQRQVGNAFKNKQDAAKYITSADVKNKYDEGFMIDAGEATVTAARTKLNRKTAGFQPVDSNKNFVDKEGNTRLYQERGTGRYLVTDNKGNIVGYSFDPAAATADGKWGGWIAYTGSKNDIKAAEAGKLRDEANRNEVNQKIEQADLRSRGLGVTNGLYDNGDMADAINEGKTATANVINQTLNLPFHTVWGALKLGIDNTVDSWTNTNRDQYKENVENRKNQYLRGFNLNQSHKPLGQVSGPGDIVADYLPEGQIQDFTRMSGNIVGNALLTSWLGRNTQSTPRKDLAGYEIRHKGNAGVTPRKGVPGEVRGNGQYRGRVTQKAGENLWVTKKKDPMLKVTYTGGNKSRPQAMYRTHDGRYVFYPKRDVSINPLYNRYLETATYAGYPIPWQAITSNTNNSNDYSDNGNTPIANFWYSGEGNPNTYAQGRIVTGEVVPGTSGENWNGKVSGGAVVVDNTNGQVAPAFGGVTVGGGRDNQSGWYLPLAYKKGGKAKLISKKQ